MRMVAISEKQKREMSVECGGSSRGGEGKESAPETLYIFSKSPLPINTSY